MRGSCPPPVDESGERERLEAITADGMRAMEILLGIIIDLRKMRKHVSIIGKKEMGEG